MSTHTTMDKQLDAYSKGKVELKDILGFEPEYLELLKGRAQFFVDGGHDERAIIMLEMLEELDRTDPSASLVAAEVLLKLGRSTEARAKVERVLARDPENAEALVALAELHIAAGELVPAAEKLQGVIDRDPDAKTYAAKRALAVAARAHALYASA